jgi:hypothetical protein
VTFLGPSLGERDKFGELVNLAGVVVVHSVLAVELS